MYKVQLWIYISVHVLIENKVHYQPWFIRQRRKRHTSGANVTYTTYNRDKDVLKP